MDIIVRVPAVPESIYRSIQSQVGWFKEKVNLLKWNIRPGDWVEEGKVIAYYDVKDTYTLGGGTCKAEILAPFAGEILTIQNIEYANWEKPDGTMKSGSDFNSQDILFVIKPSSDVENWYPDYPADVGVSKTYRKLIIFTETAKIPNAGSILTLRTKAKVETISS